jgi:ribosome biogenesis GTPase A
LADTIFVAAFFQLSFHLSCLQSALINRILGRKRAKTANTPGVTRSLQWIRVRADDSKTSMAKEFELLDSPGIIPAKMVDQSDALLLAACNCIGQAAYDNQGVAAYLFEWLKAIHLMKKEATTCPEWRAKCKERYAFDPLKKLEETGEYMTGEDMLFLVADNTCRGDPEDAARKILQDFRTGRMGPISLQLAPESETDQGQMAIKFGDEYERQQRAEVRALERQQAKEQRSQQAVVTAKERGLELPPIVETGVVQKEDDVGKGMFDGW